MLPGLQLSSKAGSRNLVESVGGVLSGNKETTILIQQLVADFPSYLQCMIHSTANKVKKDTLLRL